MREKNWLRMLKVRHPSEWDSHRPLGQPYKRSDEDNKASGDVLRGIFNEHTEVGGHQFITTPPGV